MVPILAFVPTKWAAQLLAKPHTPYEAGVVIEQKVASFSEKKNREVFKPTLDWCWANCIKKTTTGHSRTAVLVTDWQVLDGCLKEALEAFKFRLCTTLRF